jgi:hypothetical protein
MTGIPKREVDTKSTWSILLKGKEINEKNTSLWLVIPMVHKSNIITVSSCPNRVLIIIPMQ